MLGDERQNTTPENAPEASQFVRGSPGNTRQSGPPALGDRRPGRFLRRRIGSGDNDASQGRLHLARPWQVEREYYSRRPESGSAMVQRKDRWHLPRRPGISTP